MTTSPNEDKPLGSEGLVERIERNTQALLSSAPDGSWSALIMQAQEAVASLQSLQRQLEEAREALSKIRDYGDKFSGQEAQHLGLIARNALSKASQVLVLVEGWSNSAQSRPGYDDSASREASAGSEPSAAWRDIESGVTLEFVARHLDPIMDEGWHTHTFAVTIWRDGEPWSDDRSAEGALDTLLRAIAPEAADGVRELPPETWSNEAIARAVSTLGNVVEVYVTRSDGPRYSVRLRR